MVAQALVVDDSRAVRKLLAQTLRELGFETTEAENGRAALAALEMETRPFELILTDWNMPEMNGLDFLKAVRQEAVYDSVPVLMVTTETELEHMAAALAAGANEYIMKPFNRDILTDKLRLAGVHV
jgi:two-component system chemotaxis response regulator CheY